MRCTLVVAITAVGMALGACSSSRWATGPLGVSGSGSDAVAGDTGYGDPPVLPQGVVQPADPARTPAGALPTRVVVPVSSGTPGSVRALQADYPAPAPGWARPDGDDEPVEYVEDETLEGEPAAPMPEPTYIEEVPAEAASLPLMLQGAPAGWSPPAPVYRATACGCGASPCACCPTHYFQFGPEVVPGFGGGFNFGWRFSRRGNMTLAAEVGASYQDLWEEFTGEGQTTKYWGMRLGLKAEFGSCRAKFRPFVKGGITLFELATPRSTFAQDGEIRGQDKLGGLIEFNKEGSNLGVYGALGFDWCVGRSWSIGPEFGYFIGENLSRGGDANRSPYFRLNITYNF
jgi:hypothetical protein